MTTLLLWILLQRPVLVLHADVHPGPLNRARLAAIFLGKIRNWPDGKPIHPVELDSRFPEKRWFVEHILGWSLKQYRHYWLQEMMKGEPRPAVVGSRDLLLALVQSTPGSIAVVDDTDLPDSLVSHLILLPFP